MIQRSGSLVAPNVQKNTGPADAAPLRIAADPDDGLGLGFSDENDAVDDECVIGPCMSGEEDV